MEDQLIFMVAAGKIVLEILVNHFAGQVYWQLSATVTCHLAHAVVQSCAVHLQCVKLVVVLKCADMFNTHDATGL